MISYIINSRSLWSDLFQHHSSIHPIITVFTIIEWIEWIIGVGKDHWGIPGNAENYFHHKTSGWPQISGPKYSLTQFWDCPDMCAWYIFLCILSIPLDILFHCETCIRHLCTIDRFALLKWLRCLHWLLIRSLILLMRQEHTLTHTTRSNSQTS